jgi:tetratricopeptide (TPR) repeat protein
LSVCFVPGASWAHGDLDVQIAALSQQIAEGATANLYLKRAGLHHEHEDFAAAMTDYDRAAKLDPQMDAINFGRARTLFRAGRLRPAREALDDYLERKPEHADGFLLRARVLVDLKDYDGAISDFDRHLSLTPEPTPESFLERAAAHALTGDRARAVSSLDEGLNRLGNLITLQSAAITLELDLKRHDAALARVDRIMASLQRKEVWLTRRGEILAAANRHEEALRAYRDALAALEQLPAQHRNVKPMRDLEERLRRLVG